MTLIIVHPERNHTILTDPNELLSLVGKGALAQLTANSYVGSFGKKIQKLNKQLINAELVDFIVSDAHNISSRRFYMKEVYQQLEKEFVGKKVEKFQQITKDIINNELILPNTPKKIKKSKFLGLF